MTLASRIVQRQLRLLTAVPTRSYARLASAGTALLPQAACAVGRKVTFTQTRGIKTIDFGGTKEIVYERSDYPPKKLHEVFKNDTLAVLGYGPQGRGQALNLRDNKLNVILGCRKGASWDKAVSEGWVPGKTLFEITEACQKGTVIMNLLSDAAQSKLWNDIKPYLTKGKTFLFLEGRGINGSVAVYQDVSGKAKERAVALGVGVGTGYLYETTFEKEVYSDLYGERGVLMGAIQGLFAAQYEVLREKGHSPSEAFNETVEEATQSLYPLIGANGVDWMFSNCSTTAQRGALDWWKRFHDVSKPIFEELYESVADGTETRRSLAKNSAPNYRAELEKELAEIGNQEIWRVGKAVRKLRPENHKTSSATARSRVIQCARQSSSSTSAISYKRSHPHKRHPALSSEYLYPAAPSAEEAVSNILYNTPPGGRNLVKQQRHIFNCLVQNEPGVLSRVSGILAGRGFNIDSLVVAKTEVADLSRMTIVLKGESNTIEQARRQLEDLVPVWAVLDYTGFKVIQRELLLIKVSILGPEHVRAQMKSRSPSWQMVQDDSEEEMSPSNALRQTYGHLKSLTELAKLFQGKVVDVSGDCAVIELSAKPDRIDSFIKLVKPFGILEAARSGMMAMPRSPIYDRHDHEEEEEAQDEGSGVDATMLPPG
ncbi:Bifunctional acetohydroxyacid reductoisomerase [Podila epigama]|nr:Bifunctional acetohydroxyacid reductoisomerase [Podila epigama]